MVDSSKPEPIDPLYPRGWAISWLLRICGIIDCLAVAMAFLPAAWVAQAHQHLGQGDFPREPIALYLARSSSLMYAAHGILLLFLSFHVMQHLKLIRFLAWLALGHGLTVFFVDCQLPMPWWWTCLEGPLLILWGTAVEIGARSQKPENRR